MKLLSKRFRIACYRLIIAGIIISASIYIGTYLVVSKYLSISKENVKELASILNNAAEKDLMLKDGNNIVVVKGNQIKTWLEPYTRNYSGKTDVRLSSNLAIFVASLSSTVDRDPIDAKLNFENGRISIFRPSFNGKKLDVEMTVKSISRSLLNGQPEAEIITEIIEPKISLASINSLGIDTLLARGESNFEGSSPSRIQNIRVSSSLFNGAVVEPGKILSFNFILGLVEASTGYAPEKVIKSNKLVYEYGGGVCQVSTTLFRAAINTGLSILERKAHAFAVRYYTPQGMDATIYPGIQDLKFKNDTPGHILIQSRIEGTKLIFEIYGTSDNRKVTIKGPFQYDIQPDGSMKAYFTREIIFADGRNKEDKFYSNYRPPTLYPLERNPFE